MTPPHPEVEVQYEIWQGGAWQASADTLTEAKHYAFVYGQDGPVEIKIATTRRQLCN